MTVSAQTPISRSTGNGVTTVFPYTFKIISDGDIEVSVDDVVKTLNVDYTVSGAGLDAGGNVTMTTAPAVGTTVVRRRDMAIVRSTDYQDQGTLPAATLDLDIDSTVLMMQQLDERLGRTFSLSASSAAGGTMPTPAAGYVLGWDALGKNLTNLPASTGTSLIDLAASSGSSLIGFIQSGTGSVSSTVQAKLRERVSVKDFGAVGDGVTDDTAAINAAMSAAWLSGVSLYFPGGTYITQGGHVLPLNIRAVSIYGDGPSLSILKCSHSWSTVLTVDGMSQFSIRGIGFDKVTQNQFGTGLLINNTAYAVVDHVTAYGFYYGIWTTACLTTLFNKVLCRLNEVGMFLDKGTASRPNAITMLSPSLSLNTRFGLRLLEPATCSILGGSIEGNGWGFASFHGGLYVSNGGTEGGTALTVDAVQFEQNHGEADIYIAQNANSGITYNILNCSIFPIDDVHVTDNRVMIESSLPINVNLRGNNFKDYNVYTPNAARKYVNFNIDKKLIKINTGGESNQFYRAVETPDFNSWGPCVTRSAMLMARATVLINGTPAAVLKGSPYNVAAATRIMAGEVYCTFEVPMTTDDYQVVCTSKSQAVATACIFKSVNGFTIVTTDSAAVKGDADFDVMVA